MNEHDKSKPSATPEHAERPFLCGDDLPGKDVAVNAPAGARVEESPGVISLSERREQSKPSHIICVGWDTIRRLAREGAIWDAEHECGIVAADDLFSFDFAEYRYGPKAPPRSN